MEGFVPPLLGPLSTKDAQATKARRWSHVPLSGRIGKRWRLGTWFEPAHEALFEIGRLEIEALRRSSARRPEREQSALTLVRKSTFGIIVLPHQGAPVALQPFYGEEARSRAARRQYNAFFSPWTRTAMRDATHGQRRRALFTLNVKDLKRRLPGALQIVSFALRSSSPPITKNLRAGAVASSQSFLSFGRGPPNRATKRTGSAGRLENRQIILT